MLLLLLLLPCRAEEAGLSDAGWETLLAESFRKLGALRIIRSAFAFSGSAELGRTYARKSETAGPA